jgi:hypothetical protein
MDRGRTASATAGLERQGSWGAVGDAAVGNLRAHRHLLPRDEGCRVQWTLSTGAPDSVAPCPYTTYRYRHFSPSSPPSTTASAIPANASTPPGVLAHARAHTSTASTASSSIAPRATSFLPSCSLSAASWPSSSPAPSARRTSAHCDHRCFPTIRCFLVGLYHRPDTIPLGRRWHIRGR